MKITEIFGNLWTSKKIKDIGWPLKSMTIAEMFDHLRKPQKIKEICWFLKSMKITYICENQWKSQGIKDICWPLKSMVITKTFESLGRFQKILEIVFIWNLWKPQKSFKIREKRRKSKILAGIWNLWRLQKSLKIYENHKKNEDIGWFLKSMKITEIYENIRKSLKSLKIIGIFENLWKPQEIKDLCRPLKSMKITENQRYLLASPSPSSAAPSPSKPWIIARFLLEVLATDNRGARPIPFSVGLSPSFWATPRRGGPRGLVGPQWPERPSATRPLVGEGDPIACLALACCCSLDDFL